MAETKLKCPECSSYLHAEVHRTYRGEPTGWVKLECWDCNFVNTILEDS